MVDDIVIEAENISYTYPDGTLGFDELSVRIRKGERVAIVGANGSGKSTLLLVLSGLLKPTTGKVRIFGIDPEENVEEVRRNVGFLFQDPDIFLFNSTVFDELRYVPSQLGWSEEKIRREVSKIAEEFKISGILKKPPFRLSGGEKKRVALASILIYSPKILFLDEPFANVDAKTKRKIFEILKNYDGTVVFTSHELELVETLADRIIVMSLEKKVIAETNELNEEILRRADLL
ncbi:ABC transporter related protein [Ferroglobus placidus DSM 10642]|uniref:ABC transporter related protein n=1 Tax=Ferroglobus placidus (strain DSM 10642 / AEDII12DO) TaxID=589924 RepID=D3S0F5_FERPA|nr:ABC transporter ATP-binding protein [Ferroglobus placidus]ADC66218.1 ABC transporter related protein [Ferroglobus placidus DSM 10642]